MITNPPPTALNYSAFQTNIDFLQVFRVSLQNKTFALCFWIVVGATGLLTTLAILELTAVPTLDAWLTLGLRLFFPAALFFLIAAPFMLRLRQQMYMQQFADQNGFDLTPKLPIVSYPGAIFGKGYNCYFANLVRGDYQKLPFEFSNYYYTTGSGRSRQTHDYGVLRITLTRKLPHIVLDNRSNNFLNISNLPTYKGRQKLQLEGDFNKYFDLYVPAGYERDALYFITPELMQQLIDYGAKFDIEIIDNYLYIYSEKPFKLQKEETIRGLFTLIHLLGGEVQENTQRYSDANIGNRAANIIGTPGQRLKTRISWVAIVLVIIYLLVFFFPWDK